MSNNQTQGASVEAELLPCPMCGCKGAFEYGAPMTSGQRIVKARCSIGCVEQNIYRCDEAQAASAWNSRTPAPAGWGELPPLPEPDHALDCGMQPFYRPDQMQAYARAAIAADRAQLARQEQGKAVFYARQIDLDHQVLDKPYVVSKRADGDWSVPLHVAPSAPASAQPDRGAAQEPVDANGRIARRESIAANPDAMIILTQGYSREAVIRVVDAHTERNVAAALAAAPHSQPVRGVPDGWAKAMRDLVRVLRGVECGDDGQWKFIANVCESAEELLAAAPSPAAQPVAPAQGAQVGGQSDDVQALARRVIDQTIEQWFVGWPYDEKYRAAMDEFLQLHSTATEGADGMGGAK